MMAAAAAGEGRSEDALPSPGFEFGFNPQLGSGGPHFGCATSSYLCKAQDSSLLICRHLREGFFYFEYGSSRIVASSEVGNEYFVIIIIADIIVIITIVIIIVKSFMKTLIC